MNKANRHLILGGARSGKSRYGEKQTLELAAEHGLTPHYIATATAQDGEMDHRIALHQQRRSTEWVLVETPLKLAQAINDLGPQDIALIDCLTLWLSNCLHQQDSPWEQLKKDFLSALSKASCPLIIISNEVGSGIVPTGELTRHYVDELGWLHQEIAEHCEQVTLVVAGLPLALKTP